MKGRRDFLEIEGETERWKERWTDGDILEGHCLLSFSSITISSSSSSISTTSSSSSSFSSYLLLYAPLSETNYSHPRLLLFLPLFPFSLYIFRHCFLSRHHAPLPPHLRPPNLSVLSSGRDQAGAVESYAQRYRAIKQEKRSSALYFQGEGGR